MTLLSDLRREKNYQAFRRLQQCPDYVDVTFDIMSGGISAIHKEHCFDKQIGPFGYPRGQYELEVVNLLRKKGYSILLESEYPKGKRIKAYDAVINGSTAEIKTIESDGRWSVRTKVYSAIRQGAQTLVLYYPKSAVFSLYKVLEGWHLNNCVDTESMLNRIIVLVENDILEIIKPPG